MTPTPALIIIMIGVGVGSTSTGRKVSFFFILFLVIAYADADADADPQVNIMGAQVVWVSDEMMSWRWDDEMTMRWWRDDDEMRWDDDDSRWKFCWWRLQNFDGFFCYCMLDLLLVERMTVHSIQTYETTATIKKCLPESALLHYPKPLPKTSVLNGN